MGSVENTERITFLVDEEKKKLLKIKAKKMNLTLSSLIKIALDDYLNRDIGGR